MFDCDFPVNLLRIDFCVIILSNDRDTEQTGTAVVPHLP